MIICEEPFSKQKKVSRAPSNLHSNEFLFQETIAATSEMAVCVTTARKARKGRKNMMLEIRGSIMQECFKQQLLGWNSLSDSFLAFVRLFQSWLSISATFQMAVSRFGAESPACFWLWFQLQLKASSAHNADFVGIRKERMEWPSTFHSITFIWTHANRHSLLSLRPSALFPLAATSQRGRALWKCSLRDEEGWQR